MSIKCSVYIATSLDGFIARPDGDIDWLHRPAYAASDGGDLGYGDFIKSVDILVMGRKSFEKVLSFSEWPYEKTPVVVLSSQNLAIPGHLQGKVRVENLAPKKLVAQLECEGAKHLYIDGGTTIQTFIKAGLIDEITITRIPIILGSGIPLFGSLEVELPLVHRGTKSYSNGFVQTTYQVIYATKEIAQYWDTHSLDDHWDETREVKFEVRAQQRRRVTLNPELYAKIEVQARQKGVLPETLVNIWLTERIQEAS